MRLWSYSAAGSILAAPLSRVVGRGELVPVHWVVQAVAMACAMGWEILWPLILGFALSAAVQAVVSHHEMSRLLPDDRPHSIAKALALGAASSSCSYAAVALARSLFRKGANFTAAMAFEMASTNLVVELSIIMLVFLGWQFMLAEVVGAPLMVFLLVLLLRRFLTERLVRQARAQADRGVMGRMEGHADMDMSVSTKGPLRQRLTSPEALTAISHYFVMDWASVWLDIVGGLLIAGALAAWVPDGFWQGFFLVSHPTIAKFWGPVVGPLVAVIAFIFADLIVLPVLNIYRKYYGLKVAAFLFATFYISMAAAALVVEGVFGAAGLIPREHKAKVVEAAITWNYTTWLNIVFLGMGSLLVWRFLRTGGPRMLRMMNSPAEPRHVHQH